MYNDCEHQNAEIRKKTNAVGVMVVQKQCLQCGHSVGTGIAHSKVKLWEIREWDPELEAAGREGAQREWKEKTVARQQEFVAEQQERSREWWEWYSQYLRSPKWHAKRDKVLRRDEHICQACLSAKATEAHHLTYKHVGFEPLFELIGVCHRCHEAITKMDRSRRNDMVTE